jgi:Zn-dependent protease with chaperone function
MRIPLFIGFGLALSACVPVATTSVPSGPALEKSDAQGPVALTQPGPVFATSPQQAVNTFVAVVQQVEPVAEAMCRERAAFGVNCDLQIVVDSRPGQPPNAFQTVDPRGRPVVGFTLALIADARNADEIAFVMGHEAAHHIEGHIPKREETALAGALVPFGQRKTLGHRWARAAIRASSSWRPMRLGPRLRFAPAMIR